MNRLAELLRELKNHVGETYNTLDKGSTGKNIRHDANALAKTLKSSFPMLEKDPQYVGTEDLINSGFGVMPLSTVNKKTLNFILKNLEKENKSTFPKIPTNNVFNKKIEELPLDLKIKADDYFSKENLPVENISLNNLIPTQKNLTSKNISSVNGIDEPINTIFHNGNYYITDGHHRSALAKINNESAIPAYVYKDTASSLPETAFSKAHALAQKNAALPIEQGGLGLHPDNTAMERARALGFDVDNPVYHGTQKNFDSFNDGQVWLTNKPQVANQFATERSTWEGANVMPLLHRAQDSLTLEGNYGGIRDIEREFLNTNNESLYDVARKGNFDSVHIKNAIDDSPTFFNMAKPSDLTILPNNKNIRSRFAAFDPMQKNSANILASLLLGIGLAKDEK